MNIVWELKRGVAALLLMLFTSISGTSVVLAQDLMICNNVTNTLVRASTKGNGNPMVLATFVAPCRDVKVLDATTTYVTVPANNSVAAVNVQTKTATSIPTGPNPQKMVLNDSRTRLYVATGTIPDSSYDVVARQVNWK